MQDHTTEDRFQCRHIFTDGHQCGSPALRNEHFCYFHHASRPPASHAGARKRRTSRFTLPPPEDRAAIQTGLATVLERLAANDLDPRRASLLLYGLQIASRNLPRDPAPADQDTLVDEVVHDTTHGPIAPVTPIDERRSRSTLDRALYDL